METMTISNEYQRSMDDGKPEAISDETDTPSKAAETSDFKDNLEAKTALLLSDSPASNASNHSEPNSASYAFNEEAIGDDKETSRDSSLSVKSNKANGVLVDELDEQSKSMDVDSTNSSESFASKLRLQLESNGDEEDCDDPLPITNGEHHSESEGGDLTDPFADETGEQSNGPSFADICENLANSEANSAKRKLSTDDAVESKKQKLEEKQVKKDDIIKLEGEEKSLIATYRKYPEVTEDQFAELKEEKLLKIKKKTKEKIHKISRKELEELVAKLFVDKILYEHELGEQQDLCRRMELTLENNRKKAAQFHKEIDDLRRVTQKLQLEHAARIGQLIVPMKIKRSVGIQVNPSIISKGLTQLTGSSKQVVPNKPKKTPVKDKTKGTGGSKDASTDPKQSSKGAPAPKGNPGNKSGVIDLTDDDESTAKKPPIPPMVAIPNSALNLQSQTPPQQQLVTLPTQPVGSQIVLLPTSALGSGTTLLVTTGTNAMTKLAPVSLQSSLPTTIPTVVPLSNPIPDVNPAAKALPAIEAPSSPSVNGLPVTSKLTHPAPLPATPVQQIVGSSKPLPPQPILNLSHRDQSIVLLWKMSKTDKNHESISSYQLYAYQEGTSPPVSSLWTKVGSVKALELPMACTLTQFRSGHRYHFAVRAIDARARCGPFSEPKSIQLSPN